MTLSALGIFSAAGAGGAAPASDFQLISTTVLGSSQPSVTFSNLGTHSSTYKHLQIRYTARVDAGGAALLAMYSRLNGDSGTNYRWHFLLGNGSSVSSGASGSDPYAISGVSAGPTAASNVFGAGVIDLLDPYAAKNKTIRTLSGSASTRVDLHSGLWINTASLTSWQILAEAGTNFVSGSRFSLYGIRG